MQCPNDVAAVLDFLDRRRRPLVGLLLALMLAVAVFGSRAVTATEAPASQPEFIIVARVQLEQLLGMAKDLIGEVHRLRTMTGCA